MANIPSYDTTFTRFVPSDDIVTDVPSRVTYAMWSNSVGTLTTFVTQADASPPTSTSDSRYYYDVYGSWTTASAQVEFSLAYGHVSGSGSLTSDRDNPTAAIYGQYRNLLLNNPRGLFALPTGSTDASVTMSDFIAISIKRVNLKQKIDAGNWELRLTGLNGTEIHLTDNSDDSTDVSIDRIGRALPVVSGTVAAGPVTNSPIYGICYPDYGIILLSPGAVSASATFAYDTGSNGYKNNAGTFFAIMSASSYFAARAEETIASTHYFVRVKNKYYNYSTNPSFYSASDGSIKRSNFVNDPHVFITSVGLYNNNNELVAVGKLSQPVEKSFSNEALIKVRLDF